MYSCSDVMCDTGTDNVCYYYQYVTAGAILNTFMLLMLCIIVL